jgi:hypothetical protein
MKGWARIRSEEDALKIHVIHQMLEQEGVPAVIVNKRDSNYLFGEVELYVRGVDVIRANQLINSMNNE